jgi:hypothetical protein
MITSLPTSIILLIAEYLNIIQEFLPLNQICKSWYHMLHKSNIDLWWNIIRICHLQVPILYHHSHTIVSKSKHISLRSSSHDFKKTFLKLYYENQSQTNERHNLLLIQCRDLFEKSRKDSPTFLEKLIRRVIPNRKNLLIDYCNDILERNTLLLLAARYGKFNCVKYLIETYHANIEYRDSGGLSIVMVFAYRGDISAVKWLVQRGAWLQHRGSIRLGILLTAEHLAAIHSDQAECRAVFHYLRTVRLASYAVSSNSDTSTEIKPSGSCICGLDRCYSGLMIACDNVNCVTEWYHSDCVAMIQEPSGPWLCPDCKGEPFPTPLVRTKKIAQSISTPTRSTRGNKRIRHAVLSPLAKTDIATDAAHVDKRISINLPSDMGNEVLNYTLLLEPV